MATNNQSTEQDTFINPTPLDVDPLYQAARRVSGESAERTLAPTAAIISEDERIRFKYYHQLHLAALKGNWEAAKGYFQDNVPNAFTEEISSTRMNALLVASCNGHTKFVEMLVKRMPEEALQKRGPGGYTALHHAAIGGHLKMAKALIRKNPGLTQITDNSGNTPLLCAVLLFSRHKLVRYLALATTIEKPERPFSGCKAGDLMVNLTHMGFHVPVHDEDDPLGASDQDLVAEKQSQTNEAKTQAYQGVKKVLWRRIKYLVPCISKVGEKKLGHERACKLVHLCLKALFNYNERVRVKYFNEQEILHYAACCGVLEIVTASLHYFPDLIFSKHGSMILKNAIQWRQEKIFNLACKNTALDKMLATQCYKPSISHLAAQLPTNRQLSVDSCAALQMQREVQWYKAIETIQHPRMKQLTSAKGKTAFDFFSENRKQMRENAEKWMKDTSDSCMLVSTLIATVAFAVAFTVPGGINDQGIPIFVNKTSFRIFVYSDALALFSSVTSILMFLSILTSSYKEEDFHRALPERMIIGLASLFVAIATMMVAFGAALVIILSERLKWVWGPLIFLASFPVTLFIMLQLPLFIEMVQSTYGSIFQREKIWKRSGHRDATDPLY
ncbi:ankyrin repeat-containing protein ITN1-like [Herrania umbratica]|uniref:Ankyrin repeat-containing protein ITN1-like n=1 Tax=Herrania umbratica TaxID=108875 RepID=A0A6J1A9I7_9ROSI|nr:ankyrin repeat-containing protein ITN1-like [Herrania umbratica]